MSEFSLNNQVSIKNPHGNVSKWWGPYNSITEAKTKTEAVRALGFTVGVIEDGYVVEYKWQKVDNGFDFVLAVPEIKQLQTDGSIYVNEETNTIGLNIAEITERFTFNGTNRTFTLSNESTDVQAVIVNRSANLILLDDYTVQAVDQIKIDDNYNLEAGDIVRITYTYLVS